MDDIAASVISDSVVQPVTHNSEILKLTAPAPHGAALAAYKRRCGRI